MYLFCMLNMTLNYQLIIDFDNNNILVILYKTKIALLFEFLVIFD